MTEAAFILSAGFGTRFKPQTNFIPKPAIPFFNLPQALYSAALLKNVGTTEFFYNSHHLPHKLDSALKPFFKRKSIFETEILDSAGGIANAKKYLNKYENFWVANGDTFIKEQRPDVLKKAFDFHIRTQSLATLIAIPKEDSSLNGLVVNNDHILTHTSKSEDSLHFVGLYIFNKEIFNLINPIKSHILNDVLLKTNLKVSVFNAHEDLSWFETGNESDFISCCQAETFDLIKKAENSNVVKTLKTWNLSFDRNLESFLKNRVWGGSKEYSTDSNFLILPDDYTGDASHIFDSVVVDLKKVPNKTLFNKKVLINSSQWT